MGPLQGSRVKIRGHTYDCTQDPLSPRTIDYKPWIDVPGEAEVTPAHKTTVNNVSADSVIMMSCDTTTTP